MGQLPDYEFRPTQLKMVELIENSLAKQEHAIIDAGTGSGKSFAYLYPALASGQKIIISTGTIALQEQLLHKDIPFLLNHMDKEIVAMLAKGRTNYVAKQKIWEFERQSVQNQALKDEFGQLLQELPHWDGDFSNLSFELSRVLRSEVASTSDDCIGKHCEFFNSCSYFLARRALVKADLIVTNHALYLTDLAAGAGILPPHDIVIFDEAHHLAQSAMSAFTVNVGRYALTRLMQKIQKRTKYIPHDIQTVLLDADTRLLNWLLQIEKPIYRLDPSPDLGALLNTLIAGTRHLYQWLERLEPNDLLFNDPAYQQKFNHHKERLLNQIDNLRIRYEFFQMDVSERVNWVELNPDKMYYEMKSAPIDVTELLQEELWSQKTTVMTSATLAINKTFKYLGQQLGVDAQNKAIFSSPFDFKTQGALYIPDNLPNPNSDAFLEAIIPIIKETIELTEGRAFVLFSSWYQMKAVYRALREDLGYPCAAQGEMPKKKLIEWFKDVPHSILFATATFWEGIDIPGTDLSCVILAKIPFSVPDDPIIEAKVEKMKKEGKNWFSQFMLPEATIRMRQGVGRLIRRHKDRGLIVILDSRLVTRGYGKTILKSLPPFQRIHSLSQAIPFLNKTNLPSPSLR